MTARYSIGHVVHYNRQQSHVRPLRMRGHAQMERGHECILSISSPRMRLHVLARILQESLAAWASA